LSVDPPSGRSSQRHPESQQGRVTPLRPDLREKVLAVCQDVIAPLVAADGGDISLVGIESDAISLHLGGTCSGCPGTQVTAAAVIEPAIRVVAPTMRVTVSSGLLVPKGAVPLRKAR
jgi:Fe-S cluster biogenesis protein NfuA